MFFPVRTDRRLRSTPVVNYALIAANVLIFLLTREQVAAAQIEMPRSVSFEQLAGQFPVIRFYLYPTRPELYQFITYQFLHVGFMHLLGNMIFLFLFGNHVEDRLGKVGYLAFYLAGGVLAGLGHCMLETTSVLGASGAVAGVTGAYLALFPLTNVTVVYWFFIVGAFEVSSVVLILFQIAQNLFAQILGFQGVAYLAHLSGYAYGLIIGLGLLVSRLLPREPYDLWSLIAHQRRRRRFKALARSGYHPWEARPAADRPASAGHTETALDPAAPMDPSRRQLMDLRARINEAARDHDLAAASKLYEQLLELDERQTMPRNVQLDIANDLMSRQQYHLAAQAYERFLESYPRYESLEQIQLILGLIYGRYLRRPQRAVELLEQARPRLEDANQRQLADQLLGRLRD